MEKKKRIFYRAAVCSLLMVYAVFLLTVYSYTEALVPDEQWFWGMAENEIQWSSWEDVLKTPNYLGYGSIYWILLKAVGDFSGMRFLCAVFMIVSACLVPYTVRSFHQASDRQVFFSVVIYLSCPLVWFTGKVIGPEITGYALGIIGCCMGLLGYRKDKRRIYVLSLFLLGISAGVKLNDIVLAVFLLVYISLDRIGRAGQWKQLFSRQNLILLTGSGGILGGIIIANPVMLYDWGSFQSRFELGAYSLQNLQKVLSERRIEWDLVNAGGMNQTIISMTALLMIFMLSLWYLQDRKLIIAGIVSILLLITLCCKDRFLGWYLMPMIYIVAVCVPDTNKMTVVALLHFSMMFMGIRYQITSKLDQIHMIKHRNVIETRMQEWERMYPGYEEYCFIETCVERLPMFPIYNYQKDISGKQVIFISHRARANAQIEQIYQQALQQIDGYELVEADEFMTIVVRE